MIAFRQIQKEDDHVLSNGKVRTRRVIQITLMPNIFLYNAMKYT